MQRERRPSIWNVDAPDDLFNRKEKALRLAIRAGVSILFVVFLWGVSWLLWIVYGGAE